LDYLEQEEIDPHIPNPEKGVVIWLMAMAPIQVPIPYQNTAGMARMIVATLLPLGQTQHGFVQ